MRCVTVPGASFRPAPEDPPVVPIVVYLEGGWTSLSHRLAEEIKQQLQMLENFGHRSLHADKPDGMAPSVSGPAKSWDVIS